MKRLEIIANQAVEEDIIEELEAVGHGEAFTSFHPVYGRGKTGRKEGSAVWPETNVMFLVFLDTDTAGKLKTRIEALKKKFPAEGIKCWVGEGPGESI